MMFCLEEVTVVECEEPIITGLRAGCSVIPSY